MKYEKQYRKLQKQCPIGAWLKFEVHWGEYLFYGQYNRPDLGTMAGFGFNGTTEKFKQPGRAFKDLMKKVASLESEGVYVAQGECSHWIPPREYSSFKKLRPV